MNFTALQDEHAAWLAKLYPHQQPVEPAAGLVEEAGELMHVLLKCQQSRGWKHPELRYIDADWTAKFIDAVGDCGLFLCSLCNVNGWSLTDVIYIAANECVRSRYFGTVWEMVAKLCIAAATIVPNPISQPLAEEFACQLLAICARWNIDFYKAVHTTWQEVKERK